MWAACMRACGRVLISSEVHTLAQPRAAPLFPRPSCVHLARDARRRVELGGPGAAVTGPAAGHDSTLEAQPARHQLQGPVPVHVALSRYVGVRLGLLVWGLRSLASGYSGLGGVLALSVWGGEWEQRDEAAAGACHAPLSPASNCSLRQQACMKPCC